MRIAVLALGGASLVLASLPAAAQSTRRIETHPFYGAVVTVEEGVRVFRPLPPHDRGLIHRTYLHRIGDEVEANRYLHRVGEPRPGSGKP
jgi:hypothetical protein